MRFSAVEAWAALDSTEITHALAEATLNGFEGSGVRDVTAEVEFTFNLHGLAEQCPLCIELAGRRFRRAEARGVIPRYVRCQCGWLPVWALHAAWQNATRRVAIPAYY